MKIKLTLDDNVDEDIIIALKKKANGGALTKALHRAICEWFSYRDGSEPIEAQTGPEQAQKSDNTGPDDLTAAIAKIDEEW